MRKIFAILSLAVVLLLTGCTSKPIPALKGGYQSDREGVGYVVLISFQPDDSGFVEYIDSREVDRGTYKKIEDNLYQIKSNKQDFEVALNAKNAFNIIIKQLNNGNPIQMKNISTTPGYFKNPYGDEDKYKALLEDKDKTQTSPVTVEDNKPAAKSGIDWKCVYIGSLIQKDMPDIKYQIVFNNEDEWRKYANDNLPNSIVDSVIKNVDWDKEGIVVLQGYAAKGYFSFLPQVSDVRIENGMLNVQYENNLDTSKTYYVRSAGYNEIVKDIYMICLNKSDIGKLKK
ncbi:hypothetical protein [Candidatus Clostridium radicumherbarum]|uniref:DUF4825 domain-containing protein n=1 Tax=Candidatus Clostridium radicumherbarum TaxID=3381662 RepID=A0ABW8TUY0_9CLOT